MKSSQTPKTVSHRTRKAPVFKKLPLMKGARVPLLHPPRFDPTILEPNDTALPRMHTPFKRS